MATHSVTDDFTTDPWWWEAARPMAPSDDPLPETAEVVIVGAGYTGLSAALTIAERGRQVAVLDSLAPGEGASSRNAGAVGRGLLAGFMSRRGRPARRMGV